MTESVAYPGGSARRQSLPVKKLFMQESSVEITVKVNVYKKIAS